MFRVLRVARLTARFQLPFAAREAYTVTMSMRVGGGSLPRAVEAAALAEDMFPGADHGCLKSCLAAKLDQRGIWARNIHIDVGDAISIEFSAQGTDENFVEAAFRDIWTDARLEGKKLILDVRKKGIQYAISEWVESPVSAATPWSDASVVVPRQFRAAHNSESGRAQVRQRTAATDFEIMNVRRRPVRRGQPARKPQPLLLAFSGAQAPKAAGGLTVAFARSTCASVILRLPTRRGCESSTWVGICFAADFAGCFAFRACLIAISVASLRDFGVGSSELLCGRREVPASRYPCVALVRNFACPRFPTSDADMSRFVRDFPFSSLNEGVAQSVLGSFKLLQ